MKNCYRCVASLVLLMASNAMAGTYGTGSFSNDGALDWVNDCVRSNGPSEVAGALQGALSLVAKLYLDSDTASAAIAAAEVVAAANGHPSARLPGPLREWLTKQPPAPLLALRPIARKALLRISRGPRSELRELWSEGNGSLEIEWRQEIDDLIGRLAD